MARPAVTYLSRNFVLREVVRSNTAERRGIRNIPNQQQLFHACALATLVGQPLRDHINRAISVTSWYRCLALNSAIPGSSKTSSHMTGGAFDIRVSGMTPAEVIDVVRALNLPVDQAIAEGFDSNGQWVEWTHLAIQKDFKQTPRRQFMTASGDRNNPTYKAA